jgi:hypothetical protein
MRPLHRSGGTSRSGGVSRQTVRQRSKWRGRGCARRDGQRPSSVEQAARHTGTSRAPRPAGQRGHGDVRAAAGSPPAPSRGEMLRCDGAAVLRRPPSSALEQPVGGGPHVKYAVTPAGWTAHVACNAVKRGGRERARRDAVLLERAGVKERRCSERSWVGARRRAAHRGFPRPAHRATSAWHSRSISAARGYASRAPRAARRDAAAHRRGGGRQAPVGGVARVRARFPPPPRTTWATNNVPVGFARL